MAYVRSLPLVALVIGLGCGDDASAGPDAGSDAGAAEEPRCAAYVQREIDACPDAEARRATSLTACTDELDVYTSTGCGDAYGAFLACAAAAAGWDCRTGPSGCSASYNAAYSCLSEQKRATSCIPHGRVDAHCTDGTPYKFMCLTSTPPSPACTLYDDSELFAFCCP
jgi:hypothetical protein